jgi:hypothetical protein
MAGRWRIGLDFLLDGVLLASARIIPARKAPMMAATPSGQDLADERGL